ncbi:substrate-binding domain-containing protein [Dactylosporangium maewongense]|uniref:Substrate-binding domain-containing protein n=1 Tax=Dactylosporangium maewongense TaxID=634393 RepID=A0ABP4NSR5_9ACTN
MAKYSGDLTFIPPGKPIDITSLKGKTVWIIPSDLSIPFMQTVANGYKEAAAAAGLDAVVFDGKGSTKEYNRGIQQAIGTKAAAIALISIRSSFVSGALKEAQSAKIPVIGVSTIDAHESPQEGTAGAATFDYVASGKLLAAYAVAHTPGPVRAVFSHVPEFVELEKLRSGVESGIEEYCSSNCSVATINSQVATFKTQVPTQVQSELKRKPDTNWVFPAFDGQAVFAASAVRQAGKGDSIRIGSINGVKANLDLIKNGDVQVVDVGASNTWQGWAAFDRALRAMLGEPPAVSEVPIKLFDKENLEGIDTSSEDALFKGADYRSEYKKLWELS